MKTQPLHRGAWANSEPMVYTSCAADACDQGRKACPAPQACQISMWQDEKERPFLSGFAAAVAIVGTIVISVLLASL